MPNAQVDECGGPHWTLDCRAGAARFPRHLLDGDVANNQLNWQWVAGTGNGTRQDRVLNPVRQAERYDPSGDCVRRWVPELTELDRPRRLHQPCGWVRTRCTGSVAHLRWWISRAPGSGSSATAVPLDVQQRGS